MMYKACLRCHRLVPKDVQVCPYCGSKEFTTKFKGAIFILDPEKSRLAKIVNKSEQGIYALRL